MNNVIIISWPTNFKDEKSVVEQLFKNGLKQFHIRKPEFTSLEMRNYIESISVKYRKYLVLHSHFHLAKEMDLLGIQIGVKRVEEAMEYENTFDYFGYSAHSFWEIEQNKETYSHFFLSPVYNSISKSGYEAKYSHEELSVFLKNNLEINIAALGGIELDNCQQCINLGFNSIALLGTIWQAKNPVLAFQEIYNTMNIRPFVLSIAGFDPSSGAGVTADIKSFEQHKVQGLGVTTSITYQNESEFLAVDWLSVQQIKNQIVILFKIYNPKIIKIGLVENFKILKQIISLVKGFDSNIKIIWDPILKASANFDFHNSIDSSELFDLLKDIYLVTPNIPECKAMFKTDNIEEIQRIISENTLCNILLKGGHSNSDNVSDILIEKHSISNFAGERLANKDKHGTGCVLSSAIVANLAKEMDLYSSIRDAKEYISSFIGSNDTLLGYHNL